MKLQGAKSGGPPKFSWKTAKAQWSVCWRKFLTKTGAELPQQNIPPANKPKQPCNPAILLYFIEHGHRSYEQGISFARWSDRMIIVHGNAVIPYLHEVWKYVKGQTARPSSKQKMKIKLIITALVFFVLTGLFPPWQYTVDKDSVNGFRQGFGYVAPSQGIHSRKPAGYSLLFTPPANPDTSAGNGVQIDFGRLFLEWAVLAGITGLVLLFPAKPAGPSEDKSDRSQKFISPPDNAKN